MDHLKKIAIILPCYNEESLILELNNSLVNNIKELPFKFDIIYINDGSTDNTSQKIKDLKCNSNNININLLNLHFNLGHQKAIYQGLLYLNDFKYDNILIMDSDGEDDPAAIKEILKYSDKHIVQVIRGKRSESILFKLFYGIYKFIFLILIGEKIDYGNFSLIKPQLAAAAVNNSFVHLGAFLNNQKGTKHKVKWDRMKRINGNSKMNFKNLFYHGINSLTENAQNLLFLFIKLSILIFFLILILIGIILYKKYIVSVAVLGWSSTLLINLTNSLLICIGFFVIGSLQLNLLNKQGGHKRSKSFDLSVIIKNWRNN